MRKGPGIGDGWVVTNRVSLVGPCRGGFHDVHLEVVQIDTILLEAPVHQRELPENRVARRGGKVMGRHADRVPLVRIRDVELHQVAVEVGGSLGVDVKVDAFRGVTDPDPRFDSELVFRSCQTGQVHALRDLALDQRPPDAAAVAAGIDGDARIALAALPELHGRVAVAREVVPALKATRVGAEAVESVEELCRGRAGDSQRGNDEREGCPRAHLARAFRLAISSSRNATFFGSLLKARAFSRYACAFSSCPRLIEHLPAISKISGSSGFDASPVSKRASASSTLLASKRMRPEL